MLKLRHTEFLHFTQPLARIDAQLLLLLLLLVPLSAPAQKIDLAAVVAKPVSRTIDLPGEFLPFLSVSLHAKVNGYVERVLVDRGSVVKANQLLIQLTAPEMKAQLAEAQYKVEVAQSERLQAEAQLAAAQATLERLKKAAETPGAVAPNEIVQVQKQVEAAQALVESRKQARQAAEAAVKTQTDLQAYLQISAPFDGVVTDRLIHPGALVGPASDSPLLMLQQVSHLRLVAPVPEEYVGAMVPGASVSFNVPAYPDRPYSGKIARIAHALDPKTRTMAVELDVFNRDGSLSPGMYPAIHWPVRRAKPALLVPKTSVVSTTERVFVIRNRDGHAEWVDVKKGPVQGDLIEVTGDLHPGDRIVRRGTDEIHEGTAL
jgi:RND family efflux transporter MFP subunit